MAGEQLRVTEGNARGEQPERWTATLLIGRVGRRARGKARRRSRDLAPPRPGLGAAPTGELTIEDLGSANGTFVNGERIDAPRTLDMGDVVRMGQTVLQVTDASGRRSASRPA